MLISENHAIIFLVGMIIFFPNHQFFLGNGGGGGPHTDDYTVGQVWLWCIIFYGGGRVLYVH